MLGLTSSQSIATVVLVASIILYYCQLTNWQQNVWIFFFAVALLCLIVGIHPIIQTCSS